MEAQNNSNLRLMAFNALRMLPDDKLIAMYENASKQSAQGKGKKFMIRYILDSGKIHITTDSGDGQEAKKEIHRHRKAKMILNCLHKLTAQFDSDEFSTTETLRNIYPKIFDDSTPDKVPFFKPGFMTNVEKFLPLALQKASEDAPVKEVNDIVINGYKDLFILVPVEHQAAILGTIDMCAFNCSERTGKTHTVSNRFTQYVSALYHYEHQDDKRFMGQFRYQEIQDYEVSANDINLDQTEDDCPDNPLVNSHHPDIEEAPEEPQQQEAIPPPNTPDPVIHLVDGEKPENYERAKYILDNVGTLMFPAEYRRISVQEITTKGWNKLRKDLELKGRWEIFCETDPGENPKQNKKIRYKSPHFVEESYEGAVPNCGLHASDHPYGDIYLVKR